MTLLRNRPYRVCMGVAARLRAWQIAVAVCSLLLGFAWLHSPSRQVHAAPVATAHLQGQDQDRACAGCHATIYRSYQQTAMARGSGVANEALHTGTFRHTPSGVTYSVQQKDGIAWLHSRRESEAAPLDESDQLVYYIGSGKHGRTYLFARDLPGADAKLWYEAPVNWYTRRAAYGMAPAYDNAVSAPLALPTDANCLHCHATAVQQPLPNAPNAFAAQPFLQGGIGCSACHGNAAAHVASAGKTPMLRIGQLAPAKRDSVCLQCHLEGDAMVQGAGKSLSRFQPGDDLSDTAVYFVRAASEQSQRRASSQYEGMLRSACRRAVGDRMTCTTCHDPHSEPASQQRVAFYRGKCLQCHADSVKFQAATHHPEQQDCAVCHMPSRTTSDISHEQNVDHDIEARPRNGMVTPEAATLTLRSLDAPAMGNFAHASDLVPVGNVEVSDRERGLAYAQLAAHSDRESFGRAVSLLRKAEFLHQADAVVHEQLGYLAQFSGDNASARREYTEALRTEPGNATVLTNLGVLEAQSGDLAAATEHLQTVARNDPGQTSAVLNLAMLQCRAGKSMEAKRLLKLAIGYNPDSPQARIFQQSGDYAGMHCRVF